MDVCIILDNDQKSIEQVKRLITELDSSIEYEVFSEVQEFADWFRKLGEEPPEEDFRLRLIVSSSELLGATHISLFQKISEYMKKHGYLAEEKNKIPLIIAAHDHPEFDRNAYLDPIFDNVIFKPVDKLVGKGKIDFALNGPEALSSEGVQNLKPVSPLEVLKTVHIDRVTEIGFRSVSSKPIEIGTISRYYLPSLEPLGAHFGVYATCNKCTPSGNDYVCNFSFFGLDAHQSRSIRKLVDQEKTGELHFEKSEEEKSVGAVMIVPERDRRQKLSQALTNSFQNLKSVSFTSYAEFLSEMAPDAALTEWLEPYGKVPPLILDFTPEEGLFLKASLAEREEVLESSYLGIPLEDLARMPNHCQTQDPKKAQQLMRYFSEPVEEKSTVIWNLNQGTVFLTLVSSETLPATDSQAARQRIVIRAATAEEVRESRDSIIPENLQLVFVSEIYAQRYKESLIELRENSAVKVIGLGKTKLTLFEQAKSHEGFADWLIDPMDEIYLIKRLLHLCPSLNAQETTSRAVIEKEESIKVGNQIEITNFSEIAISFEYHRALSKNSIREFVIVISKDAHIEIITARYVDSEKEGDTFVNHFAIFGHGDTTNQRIREWLNEQYAMSKREEESVA